MEKKLAFFLITLGFIIFSSLSVDSASVLTMSTVTKDAPVVNSSPNSNYYNYALQIGVTGPSLIRSYMFFNISNLYNYGDINITYANLTITGYSFKQDNAMNTSLHFLYDDWINSTGSNRLAENRLTWNNQPCGKNFDNFTNCNLTAESIIDPAPNWNLYFNITPTVTDAYNNHKGNLSYMFKTTNETGVTKSNGYYPMGLGSLSPTIRVTYDSYISIISPTSGQIFPQDSPTAYLNISTLVNMSDCYWSLDSGVTNYSMAKINDTYFYNDTAGQYLSDGPYSVKFYCNQSSDGTWKVSKPLNFETDPINITVCRSLTVSDREYKLLNNISWNNSIDYCFEMYESDFNLYLNGQGNEFNMFGDGTHSGIYFYGYGNSNATFYNLLLSMNTTGNTALIVGSLLNSFKIYNSSGTRLIGNSSLTRVISVYNYNFAEMSNVTFTNCSASSCFYSYNGHFNLTNVNLTGVNGLGTAVVHDDNSDSLSTGVPSSIRDSYVHSSYMGIYTNGNMNLINVTGIEDISNFTVINGSLTKKWYLDYQVNSSFWGLLENANVTVINKSGLSVSSYLTNSSGSISRQEISEYFNDNGTITYYTPHNITVSKDGYTTNITAYNLTLLGNINKFITLNDFVSPYLNVTYPLEGSSVPNVVNYYTMEVNFTVNEIHPGYCWYNISGAKTVGNTIIPCSNGTNSFTITFTEFGLMHLYISSNDTENNMGYTDINFSILKYTGAESGGPNDVGPVTTTNYSLNLTKAQRTVLCSRINVSFANYSTDYSKYPSSVRDSIRNDLAIALGRGISNSILKYYIENFNAECPEYVKKSLSVVPEEETQEPVNYTAIFVIVGIALVIIGFILFDRLIVNSVIISKKRRDQLYGRKD